MYNILHTTLASSVLKAAARLYNVSLCYKEMSITLEVVFQLKSCPFSLHLLLLQVIKKSPATPFEHNTVELNLPNSIKNSKKKKKKKIAVTKTM